MTANKYKLIFSRRKFSEIPKNTMPDRSNGMKMLMNTRVG
jgi:hypothetical protein